MTHDELLEKLERERKFLQQYIDGDNFTVIHALRAVVELHTPSPIPDWVPTEEKLMCWCAHVYPCPTVRAIEKELG
jgi:hypothetical protein